MALTLGSYVKRWQRWVNAGLGVTMASPQIACHAYCMIGYVLLGCLLWRPTLRFVAYC
jgi:hypothetical protein